MSPDEKAKLEVVKETLKLFVSDAHNNSQQWGRCVACSQRWPCDYESAREALTILDGILNNKGEVDA